MLLTPKPLENRIENGYRFRCIPQGIHHTVSAVSTTLGFCL